LGREALYNNVSGSQNTAIGYNALSTLTTGDNNTAIGNTAYVPNATGSNQVRIGNTSVTYAGVQVAWTITSDKRWKENIKNSSLGLAFINQLRPVSYVRINDAAKKAEYGFIAQELEATLAEFGAANSGIITKDDAGMLSVRYNDLFAPLVKAVQELKAENESLKKENADAKAANAAILKRIEKLEQK
jgi:hypothetical protein